MTTLNLSEAQADGRACVWCGAEPRVMVSVGRSDTGAQVFACAGGCARLADVLIGVWA